MKKIIILTILVLSLSLLSAEVVGEIIAKIGREIILKSDLEKRIQQLEAAGLLTGDINKFDILNEMVESKLIIQQAKLEGYEVDDIETRDLAEKQIKQVASQFSSELEFKQKLKEEMGISVLELKEFYMEMIEEQKLKDQIIANKITNKISVTEVEVEEYYQEHKDEIPLRPEMDQLGMIMRNISASESTKEKALRKINQIKEQLDEGADFAELAKKESDCPSKASGGDLGFFGKGMMVEPFEKAAFALSPGEISDVVETVFGYHLIKLEEIKGDEIRARHILVKVEATPKDEEAAIKLMDKIHEKLMQGEDFSELAKTYSEDDASAVNGGIIGEFPADQFPELFKSYLEPLDYGEYTSVIREGEVLYILAKLKHIPERPYKYTEIYDQLKEQVKQEKQAELYNNWMTELKQETYIEILMEQ